MKEYQLPEIRFRFAWLVYNTISKPLAAKDNVALPTPEKIKEKVEAYRQAWQKHETKILQGMCECYDLTFYLKTIDVNISPWVAPISTPLLLNTRYEPDQFIDLLTHELFHILLNDNTTLSKDKLSAVWNDIYPTDDDSTRNHIWVHAGLKYVYIDILKEPNRLQRDIEECQKWASYAKSWGVVEKIGYKELIEKFKAEYPKLQRTN